MNKITIPKDYNYIGVFLTLGCNLSCAYCINHTVGLKKKRRPMSHEDWIIGLNRITGMDNIPVSLQGGEPTLLPSINKIINGLDRRIDLLTNIQFDIEKFSEEISPNKFERDLPYPAIRVSYHPSTMNLIETLNKVQIMHNKGYSIGLFIVDHPLHMNIIPEVRLECEKRNIFFKTKEFLGTYDGEVYGEYKFKNSVFSNQLRSCLCKTSELLISPSGEVFRCHHDLYNDINSIAHILDDDFEIKDIYKSCDVFGKCNPCDVKIKNNRFQEGGHCSVSIKDIEI